MLLNESDAKSESVAGVPDADGRSIDFDRSFIRFKKTIHTAYQRRFARTVLADQSVHLAGEQVKINVIVGDNVPKAFANSTASQQRFHGARSTGWKRSRSSV